MAATKKSGPRLGRYVALLRGLNLGKRRIPMPELAKLAESLGATNVRTYIASGNVVFTATPELGKSFGDKLAKAIAAKYGFECAVVVRSADELEDVLRRFPFKVKDGAEKTVHVSFMAEAPSAENVKKLDPKRSPPDEFVVDGREIFLHYPNLSSDSKLTPAYFDSTLKTTTTARNLRTVRTLLQMARAED